MSDHIVKAYDDDLAALKTMLARWAGLPRSSSQRHRGAGPAATPRWPTRHPE
jgi:hypothetical protein